MANGQWPRWCQLHHDYYGRFREGQYRKWYEILVKQMGADDAMLCEAVDTMISDCFSGYLEQHLDYFKRWVSARKRCSLCHNSGTVRVPDRRPSREGSSMLVLCCCPLQSKGRAKHGDQIATLEQYEAKRGSNWRDPPGVQRDLLQVNHDGGIVGGSS